MMPGLYARQLLNHISLVGFLKAILDMLCSEITLEAFPYLETGIT